MKRCDVAVVGLGIMGSATVWESARAGRSVLGLEAGGPTHAGGSSHGATRIYRQAYWEGESYLPLLRLADRGWRGLQQTSSKRLLIEAGGVFIGPRATGVVEGSLRTARAGGVSHESWDAAEIKRRLPQFTVAEDTCAAYEPGAYAIAAEDSRLHMLDQAVSLGAELGYGEVVQEITPQGDRLKVTTSRGTQIDAGSVVVCGGPWIGKLVPELAAHVRPHRIPIYWFSPRRGREEAFDAQRFPVFLYEVPDGALLYGIPAGASAERGVKIGFHNRQLTPSDPDQPAPELGAALRAEISGYVERLLPDLEPAPIDAKWCFYTMSTDESFVIGSSETTPKLHYATVCSGHGFKFATGIGATLAALAAGRPPPVELTAFARARFKGAAR